MGLPMVGVYGMKKRIDGISVHTTVVRSSLKDERMSLVGHKHSFNALYAPSSMEIFKQNGTLHVLLASF